MILAYHAVCLHQAQALEATDVRLALPSPSTPAPALGSVVDADTLARHLGALQGRRVVALADYDVSAAATQVALVLLQPSRQSLARAVQLFAAHRLPFAVFVGAHVARPQGQGSGGEACSDAPPSLADLLAAAQAGGTLHWAAPSTTVTATAGGSAAGAAVSGEATVHSPAYHNFAAALTSALTRQGASTPTMPPLQAHLRFALVAGALRPLPPASSGVATGPAPAAPSEPEAAARASLPLTAAASVDLLAGSDVAVAVRPHPLPAVTARACAAVAAQWHAARETLLLVSAATQGGAASPSLASPASLPAALPAGASRWQHVACAPHASVGARWAAALAASRASYVLLLDGAATLRPDALATLVQALQAHPECDVAAADFTLVGAHAAAAAATLHARALPRPAAGTQAYLGRLRPDVALGSVAVQPGLLPEGPHVPLLCRRSRWLQLLAELPQPELLTTRTLATALARQGAAWAYVARPLLAYAPPARASAAALAPLEAALTQQQREVQAQRAAQAQQAARHQAQCEASARAERDLAERCASLAADNAALRRALDDVCQSHSWRLLQPARRLKAHVYAAAARLRPPT